MFSCTTPIPSLSFEENNVLIPSKSSRRSIASNANPRELGQNARTVSRMLDGLRASGRLSEGVELPNGGELRIIFQKKSGQATATAILANDTVDNRILALASHGQESAAQEPKPSSSPKTSTCASKPTPLACRRRITKTTACSSRISTPA